MDSFTQRLLEDAKDTQLNGPYQAITRCRCGSQSTPLVIPKEDWLKSDAPTENTTRVLSQDVCEVCDPLPPEDD